MAFDFSYKPDGPVLRAFMRSNAFFRGVMGHVGSGKSVACAVEIFRRACEQEPDQQGRRKSRWAVIRNTNPQLKTTTIATWLDWFPEDVFGKFNWSPPYTHRIEMPIGNTIVEMEVIFLALDTQADVRKLLSLELTGAWINEAREVDKAIVDAVTSRVRRYPSRKNGGPGPTWSGVIADTNPPSDDHWWPIMSGDVPIPEHYTSDDILTMSKPVGWEFHKQPPAMIEIRDQSGELTGYEMNPERENRIGPDDKYYQDQMAGKKKEWINVYILGRYGNIFEGRPVYSDFKADLHVAKEVLKPIAGQPIYVGLDFGLTPAATFGQKWRGRWILLRELVATDMGMTRFAPKLHRFIGEHFPGHEIVMVGDPAGDQRVQTDEETVFQVLRAAKFQPRMASTNDVGLRIGAVEAALTTLVDGVPGYLISPACPILIAAKEGGYHYKDGKDRPEKNRFSHVSDAEQYMMDGTGDLRAALKAKGPGMKQVTAPHRSNPNRAPRIRTGFSPRVPWG